MTEPWHACLMRSRHEPRRIVRSPLSSCSSQKREKDLPTEVEPATGAAAGAAEVTTRAATVVPAVLVTPRATVAVAVVVAGEAVSEAEVAGEEAAREIPERHPLPRRPSNDEMSAAH